MLSLQCNSWKLVGAVINSKFNNAGKFLKLKGLTRCARENESSNFISFFYVKNGGYYVLPLVSCFSGSLVLCKTTVPESTVINPQRTETMLLAL